MKILSIGAHPDDVEFGCGGTLLIAKHKGYKVHLLVVTRGELGGNSKIRKNEQEKSAKLLRAKLYWGGMIDTQVTLNKEIITLIEGYINLLKPDLIFSPYYNDTHQDHRNISTAVLTATRHLKNVLFYEVPTSTDFVPTVFVNIGSVLHEKFRLLKIHKSQVYKMKVPGLDILENAKSTAVFRGFQNRVKYAEGFLPLRLSLPEFKV